MAAIILDEAKVAIVPGEAGSPGYVRLSFALGDEDLQEGAYSNSSTVEQLVMTATTLAEHGIPLSHQKCWLVGL